MLAGKDDWVGARPRAKQWQGRGQHQIKGKVNGPAKTLFGKQGKGTGRSKTEGRARPRTGRGKERKDKTTQKAKLKAKQKAKQNPQQTAQEKDKA